jgi:acetyltransferase-like isoleucine patch superfamily enzyme
VLRNYDLSGWFFETAFKVRRKCNLLIYNHLIHFVCYIKGVKVGRKVDFNGFPVIRRCYDSKILIGDNCTFNSAKNSVHIGLQKRCTFVTRNEKAEIIFGKNTGASGLTVVSCSKVQIGDNVLIGAHCHIYDTDFHHSDPNNRLNKYNIPTRPIIIEDNVFIGFNCFISKGVTIGENSVIGANSVVLNDIPKNSIALGNPCKVIIIKNWDKTSK